MDGRSFDRVPYTNPYVKAKDRLTHICHDCATPYGRLHHLGCDMERCPLCGGQLISCGCWKDEQ